LNSKDFWDARYREHPESWGEKPNIFLSEMDLQDISSAVDLAGGNGRNSLWLASKGIQVENVDISAVALEQFLERAKTIEVDRRCQIKESDATVARFSFSPDLLLIAYLQLDKHSLTKALVNALSQLRPGAKVLGVWHAVENLENGYGGPPNKDVLISKKQLEEFATGYQWSDLEIGNRQRVVQTDSGERVAIDVVLAGTLKG
jgi:SAM-dependent methyltransferase